MLWCDQIDVVHIANLLELDVPFCQLLWRDIEAVLLVSDVVVLAKDATQIASAKEDTSTTIVALETWLFAEMRSDSINDHVGADKACSGLLETVDATEPRAEVAFLQMLISRRAFLAFLQRSEQLIPGYVIVEEEGWSQVGPETGLLHLVRRINPASAGPQAEGGS